MNKEEEKTYNTNILSVSSTESLGPANLTGIALQIEVLSAFRTAEAEYLEIWFYNLFAILYCRYEQK